MKAFGVSGRAVLLLSLSALLSGACGSDESEGASGKCSQGATRACLGPGACDGAQSCGADGTWSACDCGGAGGSSGAAGAGNGGTGSAGVGGATGGAAGADAGAACPSGLPGPELVLVPTLTGGHYCIDSTEVTQLHYQLFLEANPNVSAQSASCSANTTFVPESVPPGKCYDVNGPFNPYQLPNRPVVCVDWCDAVAYCKWAGKRLCGKIGGGSADGAKLTDANESQWFNACSKGGTQAYPYGDTWVVSACPWVSDSVKKSPQCEGGFPGIFDMAGNVAEWEDGCGAGGCPVRGGAVGAMADSIRCDQTPLGAPDDEDGNVGLRCCAELGGGK